jgi:hypothetical protein
VRLVDTLSFAVLALVAVRLGDSARHAWKARSHSVQLLRGVRWRDVLCSLPVIVAIVVTYTVLSSVPGMTWGWWTALGGLGNPVFGTTDSTAGTPLEVVIPVVFLALLIPALPLLVWREEWVFRRGAEARTRWHNARRAVGFGLAHALVGIPIGAALALSIGGFWFTRVYRRAFDRSGSQGAALEASARAHLAYDGVIVAVVLATFVWLLLV